MTAPQLAFDPEGSFMEALLAAPAIVTRLLLVPPALVSAVCAMDPEPEALVPRRLQADFWPPDPHPAMRSRLKPISLGTEPLTEAEERYLLGIKRLPVFNDMPEDRGACEGGPRPCPITRCRHHNFLNTTPVHYDADGKPHGGAVKLAFPNLEPWEMPERESCSLDVADDHDDPEPKTFAEVGRLTNQTPQRVQQIEEDAFRKMRRSALGREMVAALKKKSRRRG